MRVLIRVDASEIMGAGHFMRCLALADGFEERGAQIVFVARVLDDHLVDEIKARGYRCYMLDTESFLNDDTNYASPTANRPDPSTFDWAQDAAETINIIQGIGPVDLIVVDHYALDNRWEERLRPHSKSLMALDDLADRRHEADYVLDQNYGRSESDYESLVPTSCRLLIGPTYALLRKEFAVWRQHALDRRHSAPSERKLLISLGGGDTGTISERVGAALAAAQPKRLGPVTLVSSGLSRSPAAIEEISEALSVPVRVIDRVTAMAPLMAQADLAIGGGGGSGWERCSLGLPTLVLTVADNQIRANRCMAKHGIVFDSIVPKDLDADIVRRFVDMDDRSYIDLSQRCAAVTDARGVEKVLGALDF